VVEFSQDELLEIKIALSRAADYTKRHDELLSIFAAEMKSSQVQINQLQQSMQQLQQQVHSESRWRSNVDDHVASLPSVFTDLAILKKAQAEASTRMNLIVGAFWAAIAVALVTAFQSSGSNGKAKAAAAHLSGHLASRPASPILPSPNSR
jgi:hypothetical protein